jgi:hypothetical protein
MTEAISINPFNAELNPICRLLTLLGAHHIFHISRVRVTFSGKVPPTPFLITKGMKKFGKR